MAGSAPLLVPSLLWGGSDGGCLHKVPFHTLGAAKQRFLRLKPFTNDGGAWVEVAVVDSGVDTKYYVVRAASPLSLVWDDPKSSPLENPEQQQQSLSPFKRRAKDVSEMLVQDIIQVVGGNRTAAFQAFIAKNGSWSVPHESCCFSLVSDKRSVDFFVKSAGGNVDGRDAELATAWRESIQTMLDNFHRKQDARQIVSITSTVRTTQRWDARLHSDSLFEAARSGDLGTLRWWFDHGCPVDFQEESTGDTVLLVACKFGLFDVARLALLEPYNARNDPHPEFGKTALQTAVSAGHASIVQLIMETAEPSGADRIIANHEDENGEAPIHVAARCGSTEITELLIEHGANLGLIDGRGRTCLHCSSQAGQAECLTLALDSGADEYLEVPSYDGFTALHLAVRANKTDCVKALLRAGANVAAETAGGSNVYNLASKQRSERIMKLLLEYDVSEGESYYDSYDDDSSSSISGEDMFKGLNTYSTAGARSPFGGSLVSPARQSPAHSNYYGGSPVFARGAAPLHSQYAVSTLPHSHWPQINHSPIVGSNQRFASGGIGGQYFPQPGHVRFSTPPHSSEVYPENYNYPEGEEFLHGGDRWMIYQHEGHPYFYNANKDSSTWEDPRLLASTERAHTPQPLSFETPPSTAGSTGIHLSGQNHDRQMATPVSYTKKLTAIPQRGNAPRLQRSPDLSASLPPVVGPSTPTHDEAGARFDDGDSAIAPQHRTSISASVQPTKTLEPGAPGTPTTSASQRASEVQSDPKRILLAQIKSRSSSSLAEESHRTMPSSEARAPSIDSDPKTLLLAQIQARSAPEKTMPSSAAATTPADSDPKSLMLAQIKSRAQVESPKAIPASDPKSMLLAQITSRAQPLSKLVNGKDDGLAAADATTSVSSLSSARPQESDATLAKYRRMISVGVPLPSVCQKMRLEGFDDETIERIKASSNGSSTVDTETATSNQPGKARAGSGPVTPATKLSKETLMKDPVLAKYMRMASVGVPAPAVSQKMTHEGVEAAKTDLFNQYHGLASSSSTSIPLPPQRRTPAPSTSESHPNVTKADLQKDASLSKYVKMASVGVPPQAIVTKMAQDGVEKSSITKFSVAYGLTSSTRATPKAAFPMAPQPRGRRRASKAMQKIHWTTVAEDKLQHSLWASSALEEDDIKDAEIERLESLFGVSPVKTGPVAKKKVAAKSNISKAPASLIDPKRANNIAISLAQFRAFKNFDDLCQAVASLDEQHLNVEKLSNMQLLLPKPEEVSSLKSYSVNEQTDGLGRAELFFLSVMKVPRFPQKLAAFKYSLQFDELIHSLTSALNLLAKACDEVIESKKLAAILRRLLAIGNLMNESAGKPQARGITLDSLIKTAKKKGSDGKTTVLDLVVSTALNNKQDIVDFWSDMPTVREAMRLDLDDMRQSLREIQTGAQNIGRSLEADQSDDSSVYLQKLTPFAERARDETEKTEKKVKSVEGKVQLLCHYFAEDDCKSSTIFGVLLEFSRLVDKSKEHHIRKEKAKKRKESLAKNKIIASTS